MLCFLTLYFVIYQYFISQSSALLQNSIRHRIIMIKMAEGREVVTKTELINQLKEKTGFTKAGIDTLLAAFADTVREEVLQHGKEIRIRDFGTFKLREIAPRKGRNPKTGEELDICASKSVIFSASSNLKFKEANEDEEE